MRSIQPYILAILLLAACNKAGTEDHSSHQAEQGQTPKYTCPMHPQVISDHPGSCPVCGMDLVKVTPKDAESENQLMLSDMQIKLANITTRPASERPVGETSVINGTLTVNQEKSRVISSRAEGRIEKLFIRETGQQVKQGQPLYTLYSEPLLTLQQEYLLAEEQFRQLGKEQSHYKSFVDAARRKLLLYGQTESQIAALRRTRQPEPRITFLSPASGLITSVDATEGEYIPEGGALYQLDDLTTLWLEAELYPGESSLVNPGDKISVRVSGFESQPVEATVNFLSPEYRANSQILIMRADIANSSLQFKPGQHAQVFFTHSKGKGIAVPVDAVIREEKGTHLYVQSGHNTFEPRMVKTGSEGFDFVEITEGLQEGDTVVVTGAYLLYSEIVLKKGTDPMAGHGH